MFFEKDIEYMVEDPSLSSFGFSIAASPYETDNLKDDLEDDMEDDLVVD